MFCFWAFDLPLLFFFADPFDGLFDPSDLPLLSCLDDIPRLPCHLPKEDDSAVPFVKSARFEVCIGSSIGRRPTMEDEVVVVGLGPAHNPNEDFFGVFDGHGGRDAAIYAAKNLHLKIGRNFSLNAHEPLKSITSAFEETNAWMMQQRMNSGSTAAVSFVVDSTLYTANVGDTRVVLGWKDKKAVRLSFDHKPSVSSEKDRIERLGGEVTKKFGVARVNGVLGVSRAFGDCKLVPFVSAVPHINILELTDETMFLIIACDGFWDEFSDQEAVELVFDKSSSVVNMGEYLSNMAIMRGSNDNVSVVVVYLNPRSAMYENDDDDEEEDEEDDDEDLDIIDEDLDAVDLGDSSLPAFVDSDDEDEDGLDLHSIPSRAAPSLPSVPSSGSISSMKGTSMLMSRTLISGNTEGSRPSLRAMMMTEEEDSSDSDDDLLSATAGGLGVGSISAWREEDSD